MAEEREEYDAAKDKIISVLGTTKDKKIEVRLVQYADAEHKVAIYRIGAKGKTYYAKRLSVSEAREVGEILGSWASSAAKDKK
jgi:hypothetical protein